MSSLEFLPLTPGMRLEYSVNRSGQTRALVVEHLAAADTGVIVRRTWTAPDGTAETESSRAESRADGVYIDGVRVLPLPPRLDSRWSEPPREYCVEALDADAVTPAGRFSGCLRIGYLIAAGDGGSGERWYAPGVGLVRETCHDEADPFEVVLNAFSATARREER